jgi:hypothetical protein
MPEEDEENVIIMTDIFDDNEKTAFVGGVRTKGNTDGAIE